MRHVSYSDYKIYSDNEIQLVYMDIKKGNRILRFFKSQN